MTPEMHAVLTAKLDDPDPLVRAHARARLAAAGDPPSSYPPLFRRALNLIGSLRRFARSGFKIANPVLRRRRRLTCVSCPSGKYDPARRACTVCGCKAAAKPWIAAERCPLGHW